MLHKKSLIALLWLIALNTNAQIQITFPVSRIVFQRNNNNLATVNITGNHLQHLDRVEARALPVSLGQGTEVGWTTIQSVLTSGLFNGFLQLKGGWYNIEVRGVLNNQIVATTRLEKVGVGEVFVVSGQSNAQGSPGFPGSTIGATDDRVSTIDYYQDALDEAQLPFKFSHMDNGTKMAPYNFVPWFWSRLGDKLAQRLNVPVLFYGAALGGLAVSPWQRSALGEDLREEMPTYIAVPGMPYRGLQAALQQYASRTGLRAVLWQQGESDASTLSEKYFSDLKTVIETSRKDSGKENLAWIVARASRNPDAQPNVINGQNLTIINVHDVFPGPLTDEIEGAEYRYDGIHFYNEGLNKAAEYWNKALEDWIFAASSPLEAKPTVNVSITCNTDNTDGKFTIRVEGNYKSFKWSNGSTGKSISVNSGSYSVETRDASGNAFFSQPITISSDNEVIRPVVTVNGSDIFCDIDSILLTSSVETGNVWNNGKSGQNLVIRAPGNYYVTRYSINGCKAVSETVTIKTKPGPPKPVISTTGATVFCQGDSVELIAPQSLEYVWSNQSKTRSLKVKSSGTFFVQVKDATGCFSEPSDEIHLSVKERPPVGSITQTGPYVLATPYIGRVGSTFEWLKDGSKLPENKSTIKVSSAGAYTVREVTTYTLEDQTLLACPSAFSEPFNYIFELSDAFAKVFPNPVQDKLLNVEAMNGLKNVYVNFYDMKGGIVRSFFLNNLNPRQTLALGNMPKGLYVVIIGNNDFSISKRIMVE